MKVPKYISVIVLLTAAFTAGVFWEKHRVLESGPLQLTSPLQLVGEKGDSGLLPKGTIMYPYLDGPSINTYVVFINTKSMDVLKPIHFKNYLTMSPIEGYAE